MTTSPNETCQSLTPRSLAVGIGFAIAINLASPYCEWVLHSQLLTPNYFPIGLAFLFFGVVALLNPALKVARRSWGLSQGELAVVFVMAAVATTIPTYGVCGYMLATISAPYYFATVENRWESYFHQYLPDWCLPQGGLEMQWFFEGLPHGESIPWGFWAPALFWWLLFLAFALLGCLSLTVILRKQWMEHERLAYPLAETAIAMTECDSRPAPAFMRSGLFWIGFTMSFLLMAWRIATYFYPPLPQIPLSLPPLRLARAFPAIHLTLYWPMMAIAYFIHLDVSFSIWFFVVLGVIQEGIFNRLGFSITSSLAVYHYDASRPALAWQSGGAFAAMVAIMLWAARRHLREVWAAAIGSDHSYASTHPQTRKGPESTMAERGSSACWTSRGSSHAAPSETPFSRYQLTSDDEIMSYRAAVLGLVVSAVFVVSWFCWLGMSSVASILFSLAAVTIFLGLSRLMAEGGLVFVRMPLTAQSMTMNTMGNSAASPYTTTAMGLSFAWIGDPICTFMPAVASAVRVPRAGRAAGRGVLVAIVAALVASFATAIPFTLYMGYSHGGYNFGTWLFGRGAQVPFEYVVHAFNSPMGVEWNKLGCAALGAVAMFGLTWLRYLFAWWPINPIGFPVGMVFKVRWVVFPIFLGWLCRLVIVSLGGTSLLRRTKPLFLGIMLGWFFGAGVSVIVDWICFFGQGHVISWH